MLLVQHKDRLCSCPSVFFCSALLQTRYKCEDVTIITFDGRDGVSRKMAIVHCVVRASESRQFVLPVGKRMNDCNFESPGTMRQIAT